MPDLNDARVSAFAIAQEAGVDAATFNRIWRIVVPAARASELESLALEFGSATGYHGGWLLSRAIEIRKRGVS